MVNPPIMSAVHLSCNLLTIFCNILTCPVHLHIHHILELSPVHTISPFNSRLVHSTLLQPTAVSPVHICRPRLETVCHQIPNCMTYSRYPSISSLVSLCSFFLSVCIAVLVLVFCLCPSSVYVVATVFGTVLFPLQCYVLPFFPNTLVHFQISMLL